MGLPGGVLGVVDAQVSVDREGEILEKLVELRTDIVLEKVADGVFVSNGNPNEMREKATHRCSQM